jgi:hypothetical protein
MNEAHRLDRHVIDPMLAHAPQDKTEAAYNRAMHMERRRQLAQIWADVLLEAGSDLGSGPIKFLHRLGPA